MAYFDKVRDFYIRGDSMNLMSLSGGIIALVIDVLFCVQILRGTVQQKLASWMLWAVLNGIATVAIICQHGNYPLSLAYTVGCIIVACCIIKSRNFSWNYFDTVVVGLVVICLAVWAISGPRSATIVDAFAVTIAAVPQLLDAYRRPWCNPLFNYCVLALANCLALVGGKSWSVEERLYPIVCVALSLIGTACVARKLWHKSELQSQPQPIGTLCQ